MRRHRRIALDTSVFIYQLEDNALLSPYPHLEWIAPNLEIADIASRIRAGHTLATPDALQAATTIESQVTGLVANDAVFQRVQAFETMVLDHLV